MTEAELEEIEQRALAAGPSLRASLGTPHTATEAFVVSAREDVLRLVAAIRSSQRLLASELDAIAVRAESAAAGPWEVFIESKQPTGGCNLIWVGGSEQEDDPDLYPWRGDDFAADEDFEFIAAARDDIPRLVEALGSPP